MSNHKDWSKKNRGGKDFHDRGGGGGGKGRSNNRRRNYANNRSERSFPKFADYDHSNYNNNGDYFLQNDRNPSNSYHTNDPYPKKKVGGGIVPWNRKNPIAPLVIPSPLSGNVGRDEIDVQNVLQPATQNTDNTAISGSGINDSSISRSRNNSASINITTVPNETPKTQSEPPLTTQIKQENQHIIKLKQEKKSSSSSSSSSESSSSDEESESPVKSEDKTPVVKSKSTETPNTNVTCSPLNIKLIPKTNALITSSTGKKETVPALSSSSSSSSSSCSSSTNGELSKPPCKEAIKATKTKSQKQETNTKLSNKKTILEDDVVCMGNLVNKIVLEDDSNEESPLSVSSNINTKKISKKTEICMICDKKGHNSFQCQMICKNCSAPYHGYRTCPHPANLSMMMQLFLEFCMQQFQKFTLAKNLSANVSNSVPGPKVASPSLGVTNESSELKRKRYKSSEANAKSTPTKKRKQCGIKKKDFKGGDDNYRYDDSDTSLRKSGDTTDTDSTSSSESLVSSRKKLKLKSRNSSKVPFSISNFTPNPVTLPVVLNGFPNLTGGAATVTNPNIASNTLNTLLLTQMLQNAIGSLK